MKSSPTASGLCSACLSLPCGDVLPPLLTCPQIFFFFPSPLPQGPTQGEISAVRSFFLSTMPASVPVSDVYGTFVDGLMSCISYKVSASVCGSESTSFYFMFCFLMFKASVVQPCESGRERRSRASLVEITLGRERRSRASLVEITLGRERRSRASLVEITLGRERRSRTSLVEITLGRERRRRARLGV